MFLNIEQIKIALEILENYHMFFGTDFLVFKQGAIPIGQKANFPIETETRKFMDMYYKPQKSSSYYYRPMRSARKKDRWLTKKFPGGTAQKTRTQSGIAKALLHDKDTQLWGWNNEYVQILQSQLGTKEKLAIFALAVWLYREREFNKKTTAQDLVDLFREDFQITEAEEDCLFDLNIPKQAQGKELLQAQKVTWEDLELLIGSPPDSQPGEGGTLTYLELIEIGPTSELEFIPAERLNLITGDNGLGKTFLLECAWWALTGQWASLQAYPRQNNNHKVSKITFEISARSRKPERTTVSYNRSKGWSNVQQRPTIPGLLVYARVDSSFAVWDPERTDIDGEDISGSLLFSKDEVWQGLSRTIKGNIRSYSEGLLRDWVRWQTKPNTSPFYIFNQILRRLSPKDIGILQPGEPIQVPYDSKEIPTLVHPYGVTPITHAAAGVKRIVAIAYFIVWAWSEHQRLSRMHNKEPQRQMVILIDEIEAHLHPRWQRVILPALLDVSKDLSSELEIQFIIATHSPLIMVSAEPHFRNVSDKLFHLYLEHSNIFDSKVYLEEIPFTRHGLIDSWLISEAFDLTSSRSLEAENAIEEARNLQLEETPDREKIQKVSNALLKLLSPDDEFWPLWKYFAEKNGAEL
jgi:predicted ATPase